ncbi:MAG: ATP-grasp domain-containing protein [Enterovibrio sp.]
MKSIWFMEGLSSQRDIIMAVQDLRQALSLPFRIIASHQDHRPEITSVADLSLVEPKNNADRIAFIKSIVAEHNVVAIQVGRNCSLMEENRQAIEALGVTLTTGATDLKMHAIANNKICYAHFMKQHGLPVVPSLQIDTIDELEKQIALKATHGELACIKPVVGIYGIGFWILDPSVSPMAAFNNPDKRRVTPAMYLTAMRQQTADKLPEPMVLMPYLAGSERSVDMVVEKGEVIAAVGRRKEGALQYTEQSGEAFELAKSCAQIMQADGLVNVQTRDDANAKPYLLEINMRPSGGICYSRSCGINLAGIFALRKLGLIDKETAIKMGTEGFFPAIVRSVSSVIALTKPQSSK